MIADSDVILKGARKWPKKLISRDEVKLFPLSHKKVNCFYCSKQLFILSINRHINMSPFLTTASKRKSTYNSVRPYKVNFLFFFLVNSINTKLTVPELYLLTVVYHSFPERANIFATRTRCQAKTDCGMTRSYKLVLNTLFVVCNITSLLLIK
jgi:hypothetical protein